MIVAEIDRDYITKELEMPTRVGKKFDMLDSFTATLLPHLPPKVRWRCKDDDGEIYYGGWLLNDNQCEVQIEVLRYCMHDAGCATIEVRHIDPSSDPEAKPEWIQEIG